VLQSLDPATGVHTVHQIPGETLGGWAFRNSGGIVAGTNEGFISFDPKTGKSEMLAVLETEEEMPGNRLNDAKCDRKGRYWVGTMHNIIREPRGSFYSIEADHSFEKHFGGFVIPNSVSFSPDDKTLYFSDSYNKTIWIFDFDIEKGAISNRRIFVDLPDDAGAPDGSTIDAEGYLWNAAYGTGEVIRYAPDGTVDRVVKMPAKQVTCVAFGGDDLDIMFVTSATQNMTAEQLRVDPLAGALFAFKPGVCGLPEPGYAG
jgi:sugar lactone lactonase YvrE